jgi:hypothetical protein
MKVDLMYFNNLQYAVGTVGTLISCITLFVKDAPMEGINVMVTFLNTTDPTDVRAGSLRQLKLDFHFYPPIDENFYVTRQRREMSTVFSIRHFVGDTLKSVFADSHFGNH